ncbi:maltokinase N-terminal cap-like domain-containing protein [Nocardia callitridis]|uniref:Maltokinase N-terminal cap domain-containing protein n=1 Tax=Nocardia callitridis TaxID=648753 RepID=A0ABP9K2T5_9NOCA
MAVIHKTTLVPTKLELLTSWLPTRPWHQGGPEPVLAKVGGFRLDDPHGAVGIEFLVVTDSSGAEPVTCHVPLAYRGAPLAGAEDGLIGTMMHGVLGQRWVYDGARDPVVVAQIVAMLAGNAQPQAQSESDAIDETVTVSATQIAVPAADTLTAAGIHVVDGSSHTDVRVGDAEIRINRILEPAEEPTGVGSVTAPWRAAGAAARGVFLTAHR